MFINVMLAWMLADVEVDVGLSVEMNIGLHVSINAGELMLEKMLVWMFA